MYDGPMDLQSRQTHPMGRYSANPSAVFFAAFLIAVLIALASRAPISARTAPPLSVELEATEHVKVKAVIDGDTVALEDGRRVRLVGLIVPKLPTAQKFPTVQSSTVKSLPGAEQGRDSRLAEQALAVLTELTLGREVILDYAGRRSDRYGRLLAQLYREDGVWLQGELLARGLARVLSHPDNRLLVSAMLKREREARESGRGLWADPRFAVLSPEEARRHLERFALVEGLVETVEQSHNRSYLRLGPDPRNGFTAVVLPESRRLLAAAGRAPESLSGQRLRVRGFIRWWNGPIIEVTHPEQIELVSP